MKYKFIFVFLICFIVLLSGCGQESIQTDSNEFIKYDTETDMPQIK